MPSQASNQTPEETGKEMPDSVVIGRGGLQQTLSVVPQGFSAFGKTTTRYYSEEKVSALVSALEEAAGMIEDWGSYASDYFREKHDLEGDLRKLQAALADFKEGDNDG